MSNIDRFINKWSEKPFYESNDTNQITKKENFTQASQFNFKNKNFRPSQETVSPLMTWYLQELVKKNKKLFNEIDINKIKAALKGVKNEWSALINKNYDKFEILLDEKKIDWNQIMELKNA